MQRWRRFWSCSCRIIAIIIVRIVVTVRQIVIIIEIVALEAPLELQLVLLPFADASVAEVDELISAVEENRVDEVESILRRSSSASVGRYG